MYDSLTVRLNECANMRISQVCDSQTCEIQDILSVHSVLILLTGFSEAARQLWMMTVSMEMMKQVNPAATNIQGLSVMR